MPNGRIPPFLLNTGAPYNPYGSTPYVGYNNYKPNQKLFDPQYQLQGSTPTDYSPYIAGGLGLASLATPFLAKKGRGGQTFGGLVSGASTGAAIGSIIPGVGTAIGAGVGALAGGLSGLFSESPEEQRQKRFDEYKKKLNEQRAKTLSEGSAKIGTLTSGLTKRFRSSAGKRAAALGRTSDVEAFELPVVEKVASAGSGAMSDFLTSTNRYFDQASLDAEQQFLLGGELDPSAVDYLGELAPSALQYMQNQEYMDLLARYYGGGG